MFDAYSSPAHQSAVERLIQLAIGKKKPAPVEDEPASQETAAPSAESLQESHTEPMQAAEEPSSALAEIQAVPGVAEDEGREAETASVEDPVSMDAVEEAQAPVAAEMDGQFETQMPEAATEVAIEAASAREDSFEEQASGFRHAVENSFEYVAAPIALHESAVAEAQAEPHFSAYAEEPQSTAESAQEDSRAESGESSVEDFSQHLATQPAGHFNGYSFDDPDHHDDHAFHGEPVESALVESILAEYEVEHADEPVSGTVMETPHELDEAAEQTAAPVEAAVEEQHAPKTPAEEASADESALERTAEPAEAATLSEVEAVEELALQDAEASSMAASESAILESPEASHAEQMAPAGGDGTEEPFKLEKYLRPSADDKSDAEVHSPDVVPSSHDTTFLKSKDASEPPGEEELKELVRDPMWKTLMQFKGWLPLVTRVLPLLDIAAGRAAQGSSLAGSEVKGAIHGLEVSQRDLRLTLQDQTLELKRVEEEVARLRDAADKTAFEQRMVVDEVKSLHRLLKNAFLYVGILLGLLVVAVGYMGFLVFTYLNHPVQ